MPRRICLYYRVEPEHNRWFSGDRFIRPWIRRVIRGKPPVGGVEKVFFNLCLGLDRLGVSYSVNVPFNQLRQHDYVGVLGRGRHSLHGYDRPNPIVAGIGLMTHPSEWPRLCEEYPVVKYLQHSEWACNLYKPYFDERCAIWPVGIDTQNWQPSLEARKELDFLLYDKILWERTHNEARLLQPIREILRHRKLSFEELHYGSYTESDYRTLLKRSRAMIFLCEHESQGIAYQECLACNVPILAWDQGLYLDPNRFDWGTPNISATSVPYFDSRCGEKFTGVEDFEVQLDRFLESLRSEAFHPRSYVLENLTLEQSACAFLRFFQKAEHLPSQPIGVR